VQCLERGEPRRAISVEHDEARDLACHRPDVGCRKFEAKPFIDLIRVRELSLIAFPLDEWMLVLSYGNDGEVPSAILAGRLENLLAHRSPRRV
jgi:hypothetical protein